MVDRINSLAAQQRRIETKAIALAENARKLGEDLNAAFNGKAVSGSSSHVTLEQYGYDEYIYGCLCYRDRELSVLYRTTDEDAADAHSGTPNDVRSYNSTLLAECKPAWLEHILNEETIGSLLDAIGDSLTEREGRLDRARSALHAITEVESANLDAQMATALEQAGDVTLSGRWRDTLDASHMDSADSLARSSSFLESVCATILRARDVELPKDKSLKPLLDACVKSLPWPDKAALADAKQAFAGVQSIAGGVGTLRTRFSTAHGATAHLPSLDGGWAVFAKNASAALAIFLLDRHTRSAQANSKGGQDDACA
ncbi:abortive infection family protein [Paraburkholderia sp. J41]|uniref:abortive infection family protein n=1 Tax=Paraburkholderia sp. J41 TaxID=2805433 RepID=UPI002AC36E1E|nr:abortive infection family protein [Paraburkholderia sp. J41]